MKIKAIFILLIVFMSILSPFSIHINLADNDTPALFTLNVCHASDAPLSGSADLPCLYESPINHPIPVLLGNLETHHQTFIDLLIPFQEEKPPKA